MNSIAHRLWNDDAGFIVSIELILLSTVAIIGLIAGMTAVRDAVVVELSDVAGAVQELNQSYTIFGVTGHAASTAGSQYLDAIDFCDSPDDVSGIADNCITFDGDPALTEADPATAPTQL